MGIFKVFRYSEVLGGPRNRTLSYYKSVGIRHFFGNIEGGPLSGGPLLPTRAKRSKSGSLLPTRAKRSKSGSFGGDPTSTCLKTVKIHKKWKNAVRIGRIRSLAKCGGFAPHILQGLPGPRGRPDLKNAPKIRPARLQVPGRLLTRTATSDQAARAGNSNHIRRLG